MTRRDSQTLDVACSIRMRLEEIRNATAFEAGAGEPGRHRASKQPPTPAGNKLACLPDARRDHVLHLLAGEQVAAQEHLLVRAVWMQEHQADRIAAVEVPDLVEGEAMEQRTARRIVAVQPDPG